MSKLSGERSFALFYAALFGSMGATGPFLALWMQHIGIGTSMIGVIVAAPSVLMLFTTISLGRWADNLQDRRTALLAANWIILCVQIPLFLYTSPWFVLAVWSIAGIVKHAMIPATDAAALSLTEANGSDFARVRMWGSIAYIVTLTAAGLVYERTGISNLLAVLLTGNVISLLLAYTLPNLRPVIRQATNSQESHGHSIYQAGILLTLVGSALINASHAMFNIFGILNMIQHGLSESIASFAVGVGVLAEVLLMWRFKHLSRAISARACLMTAAGCGAFRWIVMANEPSLAVLFSVQLLHGVTFGIMYLATASFIARRVPAGDAVRGQSLSATLATAGLATGTFFCGLMFDQWGESQYWIMALLCVAGAISLAFSYRCPLGE